MNGPPWILTYPWRGREPGESRIMMPCGDLNYVLRVCSSTGSTDIHWSDTWTSGSTTSDGQSVCQPHYQPDGSSMFFRSFSPVLMLTSCPSHFPQPPMQDATSKLQIPSHPTFTATTLHLFLPPSTFGPRRSRLVTAQQHHAPHT